ncbi:DUF4256 domain-containing protein [Comamonas piscis]|uniref:DUF4256 domain-containing protein n=1 Tax=Comamonas piscis TaxID=1562974 RepID=A0A7G5EFM8_9BURK|nr:DUF4256 domain-containing protein [Comamonas piscis]QMV72803.1 DUF4256 domain-containing protein [Comamonas piscis]WSO35581.1 DUF4256 domain-containing protein [Comamonas piscis]
MNKTELQALMATLKARFEAHPARHPALDWALVQQRIDQSPAAQKALAQMEASGGEPDVIQHDSASGQLLFADCAAESPTGRRSLCFDEQALAARKENKPAGSAQGMAAAMGVQLLDEEQYRHLQTLGAFDCKTSSWLATPDEMRHLGGALFGDRRYGRVFSYHNGVQSYYAARGFRAGLWV